MLNLLRNIVAVAWLAWHWKDLRQDTRRMIFEDMCRIRKCRRFLEVKHD